VGLQEEVRRFDKRSRWFSKILMRPATRLCSGGVGEYINPVKISE
jgi:hypothetical protein